jgi:hypothetical protein
MVNTTRDGLSVQDARYDNGVYSVTYVSPDLVEEVRIIVAPADAETGRGAGQVQMATRSGTNQFRPAREGAADCQALTGRPHRGADDILNGRGRGQSRFEPEGRSVPRFLSHSIRLT